MKLEDFKIEPINYNVIFDNKIIKEHSGATISLKDAIKYPDGTSMDMVLYCEDEKGNVIEFKSTDEAKKYLTENLDILDLYLKGKELHCSLDFEKRLQAVDKVLADEPLPRKNDEDGSLPASVKSM